MAAPFRRCLTTADAAKSERLAFIDDSIRALIRDKNDKLISADYDIHKREEIMIQLDKLKSERKALFSDIPLDTVNFATNSERLEQIDSELKGLLKFKGSSQEILDEFEVDIAPEKILSEIKRLDLERAKLVAPRDIRKKSHTMLKHDKKRLGSLGSVMDPVYQPQQLVTKAPKPQDVTLELLMASQTHMGHATSLWNPANQRYIQGIRQGIHIISLEQTATHLRRAAKIVEGVAYHGGIILFVGTRAGMDRAVVSAAANAGGCHLFERWIPGTITNSETILMSSRAMAVDELDRKIESEVIDEKISERRALKPDLVICFNPLENYICLRECAMNDIPTIGVIDTDADPTWVTYPIPANDDS